MKQEYIILAILLILLIFLVWKEMKRLSRAHLALRLIASTLAVAALACLVIPVTYSVPVPGDALNKLILLTPGSPKELPAAYRNIKKITTDPSLASLSVQFVPALPVFLSGLENTTSLEIAGYGIDDQEWKILEQKNIRASYLKPVAPNGFVKANWPQVIRQGDRLNIYGTYENNTRDSIKIVLSGVGVKMDSSMIGPDTSQHFHLHCLPVHPGTTIYELQAFVGHRPVHEEKVPVDILPGAPTRILFISSSPNFENKFLTSWLYKNRYPAAIRNTVSQQKYDQQFLNMPALVLQKITTALLEKFDVLIADDVALSALNANEASALKAQLDKGMGLILQTDSTRSLSSFSKPFAVKKQAVQATAARSLILQGPAAKTKPLPAEQWFSILDDPYSQSLVTDERQSVIVSSRLYGTGRVILNTAAYTHSWVLSGNEENYSAFWSLLINKAARQNPQKSRWKLSSAFPTADQPTGLVLETTSAHPPIIKTAAGELYTTQTSYLPDTWEATWWPAGPGWQTLSCVDTVNIYVFEKGDWSSAKASELISRNTLHAAQQKSTISRHGEVQKQTKHVPAVVFYFILLIACTYLWWEGKRP